MIAHLIHVHKLKKAETVTLMDEKAQYINKISEIQVARPDMRRAPKRTLEEDHWVRATMNAIEGLHLASRHVKDKISRGSKLC